MPEWNRFFRISMLIGALLDGWIGERPGLTSTVLVTCPHTCCPWICQRSRRRAIWQWSVSRRSVLGTCGRQFNERSAGVLNRTCLPSDVIAFVVFCRLRYRLTLRI